ncbi:MAG TPA: AAA family ATPase [Vicinamibacterales bacterium]|nr:AAA family ATPase [Vicinamibacterales bacterium]
MPLTRKASHLLASLLAARGRWVSKQDLLAAVWPDTHVHPDNVKVLIREIRLALNDDAGSPRYVRSEIGRGYSFVAETTDRPGPHARVSDLPLFVNRTSQLAALMETLDSVRAGCSRVVLVAGDRGIGKSALCDMFLRVARATVDLRAVLGECMPPSPESEPLQSVADALHACCRDTPWLPLRLAERAPAWAARIQHPPAADVPRLVVELPAALTLLAREMPLVVVVEDLQRADGATLEAVAHLAQVAAPARCLVVATACPYDATPAASQLAALTAALRGGRASLVLDLEPLGFGQVGRYVDARLGPGAFSDLVPALHELSGGNPAVLVAAVDCLAAHGRLDTPALRDVVAAGLDRLTAEERVTLEAAAAAATAELEFAAATVAIAAGLDETDACRCLDRLARRRRVICAGPDAYRFLHPMYRELLLQRAPIALQLRSMRRLAHAAADDAREIGAASSGRHDA